MVADLVEADSCSGMVNNVATAAEFRDGEKEGQGQWPSCLFLGFELL
jgi:hypothetical protein